MAKPIKITIVGDDKSFQKAMGRVEKSMGSITGAVAKLGGVVAAAGLVKLGADAVGLASDLGEASDAASTIFGEGFADVEAALSDSATSMGVNRAEALSLANGYGVLFKELDDTTRSTIALDLAARAADVGSMFNTNPDIAAEKFRAALNGSSETVREFGIDTSDAAIKMFALENGIEGTNGVLTEADKKLIRYQIIMRDSEIAAGNFGDTSDGLANQQRILAAQFEEVQLRVGEKLLPAITKVAGFLLDHFIPTAERLGAYLAETFGPVITKVAGFIEDRLLPMFRGVSSTVDGDVHPIVARLRDLFNDGIKPAMAAVSDFIAEHLWPAWQRLYVLFDEKIRPVLEKYVIPVLLELAEVILGDVMPVLLDIAGIIVDTVITAIEGFFTALETLIGWIDSAIDGFERLVRFVRELPGKIRDAARGLWDGIPKPPSFITDGIGGAFGGIAGFAGFAGGTGYAPGGAAIVGERGPEVVNLPRGSRVVPNHEMDRTGVGNIVVNVSTPADPWQIGREVAWAIRTEGV